MRDPQPGEHPVYQGWRQVPLGLFSKTQLADLDFPRLPGGPVRAHVQTRDWNGRKATFALYRLAESVPSPAGAAQLEAARRRSDPAARVCTDCGARPDRPVVSGRCPACAQIVRIRSALAVAADDRARVVEWARTILVPQLLPAVVLRVVEVLRAPAPSGRQDLAAVALRVDAVDITGRRLVDATIRLAGPRVKAVPADAVAPDAVADQIRAILGRHPLVTWDDAGLWSLRRLYDVDPPHSWYAGNPNALSRRAAQWRGEIDPDTLGMRSAIHPGSADRMLLFLQRMAATVLTEVAP